MLRKTIVKTALVLAALGTVSALAIAAGGRHHGHGRHGGGFEGDFGGGRHGFMRLARQDADKDGTITLDEFLKPRGDRFAELDKNADGVLDADELTARMQAKTDHRMRRMMAQLDANGDGKVTKDELEQMRGHRFGWHGRGDGDHKRHRGDWGGDEGAGNQRGDDASGDRDGDDGDDVEQSSKAAAAESPGVGPAVEADDRDLRPRGNRGGRHARMIERLDANSDGVIDKSDLEARSGEAIAFAKRQRMHVLDKDRDGKVTKDEFAARPKQRFADLDLDGDGKITASDLPPRVAERWQRNMPAVANPPAAGDKR